MLFKEEDAATKLRRGLLIDFDNAAKITDSEEDSPSHYRTARILLSLSTTMVIHNYFREPLLSWH